MNKLYSLCGWQLRSEIALPELPHWQGTDPAESVTCVVGTVPETLGETALKTDVMEVSADGRRARMRIANVGTYLIESGNRIVVQPDPGMDAGSPDIRLFLLGGGLGYLCHQRGVLPVHAAVVEIDGRAALFTGVSGAGKSTLASAFLQRGHRVLSDDIAPIALESERARILPSIARIRLWPDSATHVGWPAEGLEQCRSTLLKVTRPLGTAQVQEPLTPIAVFHLQPGAPDLASMRLLPITGGRAVTALGTRVYRERGLMATAGRPTGAARIAMAASRIPHHFRMERKRDFAFLPATVDAVIEKLRTLR